MNPALSAWGDLPAALRRQWALFVKEEGTSFLFAVKLCLAVLLAMSLSMRFQLDQPRTAMITVVVVMQPQTAMILAKSLYRVGATVVGLLVSLLLVGCFAQERVLFLVGLACWIALCTGGAAFHRNFRSYGFVLAGYTAAMVGLPAAAQQPDTLFQLAVTRLSEVVLGIVCAGVVNDLLFPRRLTGAIEANLAGRYALLVSFVRASLAGAPASELERMHLRMVDSVIGLETLRGAAVLEDPQVRARDRRLRKLNRDYMSACTSFYSFQQVLNRVTREPTPVSAALQALYGSIGKGVLDSEAPPFAADSTPRRIAALRVLLSRRERELAATLPGEPRNLLDFQTALELLHRFLHELHGYARSYAALPEKLPGTEEVRAPFPIRSDPAVAASSALRALVAILAGGLFWLASGWVYGISMVMNIAINIALLAAAPDPPKVARGMVIGFGTGFVATLLFKFLIVPELDSLPLLCAALFPFLLLGGWLMSKPRLAGIGTGFLVMLSQLGAPTNPMRFDPIDSVNDGVATLIGVALAGVCFATLVPTSGRWLKRRGLRQLRRQVVAACFEPLPELLFRFESATRDILQRQVAGQRFGVAHQSLLMGWYFSVMEIGRALIHLRQELENMAAPPCAEALQRCVAAVARLYADPTSRLRGEALAAVAAAIEALGSVEEPAGYRHRLLVNLHYIHTALLDRETVLPPLPADAG